MDQHAQDHGDIIPDICPSCGSDDRKVSLWHGEPANLGSLQECLSSWHNQPDTLYDRCNTYLDQRIGTYEFRKIRYTSVVQKMSRMGLRDDHLVVDVGAGRCELNHLLHELYFRVRYLPVDGSLDGTDLETWQPPLRADFFAAIEILEHIHHPQRLMRELMLHANKGIVATTPNPLTTDVMGMDHTHVTPLYPAHFAALGWKTEIRSHFGQPDDSILAWWEA